MPDDCVGICTNRPDLSDGVYNNQEHSCPTDDVSTKLIFPELQKPSLYNQVFIDISCGGGNFSIITDFLLHLDPPTHASVSI